MTTHRVYRFYDSQDTLLYVGCTSNWDLRLIQHRSHSLWFSQTARIELDEPLEKREAFESERIAIRTEAPLHNVVHSESWAALELRDPNLPAFTGSEARALREARGETLREMAQVLRMCPGALARFETGQKAPTIGTAVAIARHLDVEFSVVAPSSRAAAA